jgi:hypothetical protein
LACPEPVWPTVHRRHGRLVRRKSAARDELHCQKPRISQRYCNDNLASEQG